MIRTRLKIFATAVAALGFTLLSTGTAEAAVAYGVSCGAPAGEYDAFGNAAPCTANFYTSRTQRIQIQIDIISRPGLENIQVPHRWSVDTGTCGRTLLPKAPPTQMSCRIGPGHHTVYVDRAHYIQRVDLKVYYTP